MTDDTPQLYLIVEAGPAAEARLAATLAAVRGVAAVLVRGGAAKLDAAAARPLVETAQKAGIAALVADDAALARALRADGVHLSAGPALDARYAEARDILGTRYTVGVALDGNAENVRHQAMEIAEAGAEYVGFTAGPAQAELVQWWSEIFEIPCVALDVADAATAAVIAGSGAEFVAAPLPAASSAADAAAHLGVIAAAINSSGRAGA